MILNCRLFAFALKMILNLILKTNLKTISDLKIESESDFQSENDCMFHVKLNHKKPIYGQKIILPRFSFVKNFFKKFFGAFAARVPKKKRLPEGSLAEFMKIALFAD